MSIATTTAPIDSNNNHLAEWDLAGIWLRFSYSYLLLRSQCRLSVSWGRLRWEIFSGVHNKWKYSSENQRWSSSRRSFGEEQTAPKYVICRLMPRILSPHRWSLYEEYYSHRCSSYPSSNSLYNPIVMTSKMMTMKEAALLQVSWYGTGNRWRSRVSSKNRSPCWT